MGCPDVLSSVAGCLTPPLCPNLVNSSNSVESYFVSKSSKHHKFQTIRDKDLENYEKDIFMCLCYPISYFLGHILMDLRATKH